jgi:uncharacterized phage-associated protein
MKNRSKIEFKANPRKALEAVLYVLSKRTKVNQYNILKIIFEADKYHLNHHARPVTGDLIVKMDFGTVPSLVYDMLKQQKNALIAVGLDEFPFKRDSQYMISATRAPALDLLSKSDIEALDHGIEEYIDLSFSQVMDKNHREKSWLEGEPDKAIPFENLIENKEVLEYLSELDGSPLRIVV